MLGLVAVLGAFVQAVVGLGMGLVAAPVVGLLAPSLVPALPLWLALMISGLMLAGERAHIDWRALAWALPGRVPGTVVGAWLVTRFTEEQIGIALALMTLLAVAVAVRAAHVPVTPATLVGRRLRRGRHRYGDLHRRARDRPAVPARAAAGDACRPCPSSSSSACCSAWPGSASPARSAASPGQVALVLAPGVVAGMLVGRAVRDRIHRDAFRAGVPRRLYGVRPRAAGPLGSPDPSERSAHGVGVGEDDRTRRNRWPRTCATGCAIWRTTHRQGHHPPTSGAAAYDGVAPRRWARRPSSPRWR